MSFENKYKAIGKTKLAKLATVPDFELSPKKAIRKLEEVSRHLSKFQELMYAHNRYSFLICIQGMDTAGKDSLIREVFKSFNARGVVVQSFKKPTATELEHDYLWRHYIALPEKGKFTVFNRTHYENVLVSRVHPEIVLHERLPQITSTDQLDEQFWEKRYKEISNFEEHISNNGVVVLKFFLHLGKDEQKKRILRRLGKEKHHWKFAPEDVREREFWDEYQTYYEEAIEKTSTKACPWYVIPADNKELCRYIFASILLEITEQLTDVSLPELPDNIKDNLSKYRERLLNE
ncbi:PPK2 family polyphosphate kinase [Myroides odoratus]|jgi:PPK2 family polyphosphate:nucleotide phosphotransferase|uniref:Polyphosphate kinase 2 family protein n=1 Tax=Myroides odoratus TaxID=256 RepID=A0A9Q6Z432_MYROD|nr:PPK2 family polyphosphate kinase [Myroides odoratus]EHQ43437.1 polyphosphate:nucleotide phosphotransferase, PPK2 family [Myroides odoratus DSM 2801]EKB06104.1 PPK2 family polyphosphate:nucleotide phosphotransferase [Myroides odoratus CIP 103059]QQU00774.1 polyphosphate kinase 2 family protein [Myroides odoratus]WQD56986.1 PPK2 family polyphosphate kinase [Myroides odoratus]STZ30716.1 polyphosphate:nucleotide phosphotransferase, PPK2 family [Myroides odoratus]